MLSNGPAFTDFSENYVISTLEPRKVALRLKNACKPHVF